MCFCARKQLRRVRINFPKAPVHPLYPLPTPQAPEVLKCPNKSSPEENKQQEDLAYTCSVDVWSTASMAYELLTGMPPFGHEDRYVLKIGNGY